MKLQSLHAREVLDSRGNPTVAVRAILEDGTTAEAMVPSGASTGVHEALELRDEDEKRYNGKGVLKACDNVNSKIFPAIQDMEVEDQRAIDSAMLELDGTENKSNLGANAILGVSLAVAQAAAKAQGKELYEYIHDTFRIDTSDYVMPYPTMNIVNGGQHANNNLNIQEFMVVPQADELKERVRIGAEVFHALKNVLNEQGRSTAVGDEGGFAPELGSNEDALKLIKEAVGNAGYEFGKDVKIAMDPAASEFFKDGKYEFDKKMITADELTDIYDSWIEPYAIISIEDGLSEDDWDNWVTHTKKLGDKITLVGDDLFVTNVKRLQEGIDKHVGNAILIKVNQIGSLSETIDTINLAREHGYKVSVSHRSGETEDTTIADLAVAVNADFIKTGSLSRSERIAKYNRLMAIELHLGK
ncbi:MAG: phosphopyruvate hydratase [Candidatus Kerfeldbacteria bacterium]